MPLFAIHSVLEVWWLVLHLFMAIGCMGKRRCTSSPSKDMRTPFACLRSSVADVNRVNDFGDTALGDAVVLGATEIVNILLVRRRGSQLRSADERSCAPLCPSNRQDRLVAMLLDAGVPTRDTGPTWAKRSSTRSRWMPNGDKRSRHCLNAPHQLDPPPRHETSERAHLLSLSVFDSRGCGRSDAHDEGGHRKSVLDRSIRSRRARRASCGRGFIVLVHSRSHLSRAREP